MPSFIYRRLLVTALLCLAAAHTLADTSPLRVKISSGASAGSVNVVLTNQSTEALSILRWDTPFENVLSDDIFVIVQPRKGVLFNSLPYIGRHVKRATATAKDFLLLEPGSSTSATIQLSEYYQVDASGLHSVQFRGDIQYTESNALLSRSGNGLLLSESLTVDNLQSDRASINLAANYSQRIRPPAYDSCTAEQQTDIVAASELSQQLAHTAVADLTALAADDRTASPRYTTWFGAYAEDRFNTVLEHFTSIENALDNETIRYSCGCDEEGVFAYVFANRPYDIYLCPAFRQANNGGTDSRAGTIIHELSHFEVLAGTDDHVYSQPGAEALAISNPELAVDNADSHEYFAENTPTLPILNDGTIPIPVSYPELPLNTLVEGHVEQGETIVYRVVSTVRVELISVSGDADLAVLGAPGVEASLLCRSTNRTESDICGDDEDIITNSTLYLEVTGFSAADFTLQAFGREEQPLELTPLALDTPVSGSLEEGEFIVYEVNGAGFVELESLTGDADLYIFNSTNFDDSTLVCSSDAYSEQSVVDSCIIPLGETFYVLVSAFTATDYSIVARATTTNDDAPVTDNGRLIPDELAGYSIAQGEYHLFVVNGAQDVVIDSTSGDADLAVYSSPSYDSDSFICTSDLLSENSTIDRCDMPVAGEYYITVFGYTPATYTIIANSSGGTTDGTSDGTTGTTTDGTSDGTTDDTTGTTTDGTTGTTTDGTSDGTTDGTSDGTTDDTSDGTTDDTTGTTTDGTTGTTTDGTSGTTTDGTSGGTTDGTSGGTIGGTAGGSTGGAQPVDDGSSTLVSSGGSSGGGALGFWWLAAMLSVATHRRRVRVINLHA